MLENDAQRAAAAIAERANGTGDGPPVTATVKRQNSQPAGEPPRGAARPTITRYFVAVSDGTRAATLSLVEAEALVEEITTDWDPDRLFDAIRDRGVSVEDAD